MAKTWTDVEAAAVDSEFLRQMLDAIDAGLSRETALLITVLSLNQAYRSLQKSVIDRCDTMLAVLK